MAFSPDGKRVASSFHDGTVGLWDPTKGERRCTLKGLPGAAVINIAFSSDGTLVALAFSYTTIELRDAVTWERRRKLYGHLRMQYSSTAHSVAFSPDSKLVASASANGTARAVTPSKGSGDAYSKAPRARSGPWLSPPDSKLLASAFSDGSV